MSEADLTAGLLGQLAKLIKALPDEEVKRIVSGETKLAILPPGHKVIELTIVVDRLLKAAQQLDANQVRQLEEKGAKLAVLRKGDKILSQLDPVEVAEQVAALKSEAEIVRMLDEDSRLTAANLKRVAAELNVIVPATVKTKPALQLHIAQSVIRDSGRWSWR